MISIHIHRPHVLKVDDVRAAARRALDGMRAPMGLDGSWEGDVYRFTKPTAGRVTLEAGSVRVEVTLGTGLRTAKGSIEKRIEHELDRWLGPRAANRVPP